MSHGSHLSFFGGLRGFLVYLVSHHSYLCGVEVYPTRTHALNLSSHKLVVFCTVAVVNIGCLKVRIVVRGGGNSVAAAIAWWRQ